MPRPPHLTCPSCEWFHTADASCHLDPRTVPVGSDHWCSHHSDNRPSPPSTGVPDPDAEVRDSGPKRSRKK